MPRNDLMLRSALKYAEILRWPVFPLKPRSKEPDCSHGFQDATTDERQIRKWWPAGSRRNIATPTGIGFWVLDVDPRNGGSESLEALEARYGRLPSTIQQETGGGGRHFAFALPDQMEIRCGTLADGLDYKGSGGYIAVAPSVHPNGKVYIWDGADELANQPILPAPGWLLTMLQNGQRNRGDIPFETPQKIPKGKQHATLVSIAGSMRARGLEFPEIFEAMRIINETRCTEPGSIENIRKIAESICRYPPGASRNGDDSGDGKPDSASPEPDPQSMPDAEQLLPNTEAYIRRYVVLPPAAYLPAALWSVGTHAVEQFDCYPYLCPVSAVKRSGKTRFAEALETLVRDPWRGTTPSPAAVYRMLATAPTLLLDEMELLNGKDKSESVQNILAVLNAGHRKGATVVRCDGPKQEIRKFPVYGPKLFAAIGRLPDTLMDRSIIIRMKRRLKTQPVARFRQAKAALEAKPIQAGAAAFVRAHKQEIEQAYQSVLDQDLDFLNDRDADLWTPLFALCSVLDPDRVNELKKCAVDLSAIKAGADLDDSYALTLLRDIRDVWPGARDKDPEKNCETALLLEKLKALDESPWAEHQLTARKLARMLRPFEVEPKSVRIENRTPKGYVYDDLKAVFALYLEDLSATSATTQ